MINYETREKREREMTREKAEGLVTGSSSIILPLIILPTLTIDKHMIPICNPFQISRMIRGRIIRGRELKKSKSSPRMGRNAF